MAKIIGMSKAKSQDQTLYDPTCGSGSLLLKAADEAPKGVTIYGQAMDWDFLRQYLREARPDMVLTQGLSYWGWACYPSKIAPSPPGGPGGWSAPARIPARCWPAP